MNNVVVIDDNSQVRSKIKNLILNAGYKVFEASNGRLGMDLIQNIKPQLVVTEIIMPEQDGLEIISAVNIKFPETKIIAMSAGGGRLINFPLLELALKIGADFIFDKPLDENKFIDLVKRIFSDAF
jgi:YesN/AraC family two-component response regulator